MNTAAANITAPKMTNCSVPGTSRASRTPNIVPSKATPPNAPAMRTLTFPARQWLAVPNALVAATMARLMAMASLGEKPSTYTKMGTVRDGSTAAQQAECCANDHTGNDGCGKHPTRRSQSLLKGFATPEDRLCNW